MDGSIVPARAPSPRRPEGGSLRLTMETFYLTPAPQDLINAPLYILSLGKHVYESRRPLLDISYPLLIMNDQSINY